MFYIDTNMDGLKDDVIAMLVVELKYDKSADKALDQIYDKHYADELADYTGRALLVGINYNSKTKVNSCVIEEIVK